MAGHKSIKRIVHRCMEELDATERQRFRRYKDKKILFN